MKFFPSLVQAIDLAKRCPKKYLAGNECYNRHEQGNENGNQHGDSHYFTLPLTNTYNEARRSLQDASK